LTKEAVREFETKNIGSTGVIQAVLRNESHRIKTSNLEAIIVDKIRMLLVETENISLEARLVT
jgi:hypothetical protein